MNKGSIVLTAILLLSAPSMTLAQMDHSPMDKDAKCQCPMMKTALPPMVVATSDGGVVVVMGRTMTKYDQDLDQTGSVELKACPLCGNMPKCECPLMAEEKDQKAQEDVQAATDATVQPVADGENTLATETEAVTEVPTVVEAPTNVDAPIVPETAAGGLEEAFIEIKPAGMVETAAEIKSEIESLDVASKELGNEVKSEVFEGDPALDASADVLKDELDKEP